MMITETSNGLSAPSAPEGTGAARRVLRMARDDGGRMAGSMPVWEAPVTAKDAVAGRLAAAGRTDAEFSQALSYVSRPAEAEDEAFGFGDLLDMINPLQHIPLVSSVYRHVTGDEIRPAARVVGDTIYGGPLGAVAGIVNVVVEEETGKDITGNVMAAVRGGQAPHYRTMSERPAQRLAEVMPSSGDESQIASSPHFSGFTPGWRDGVFMERPEPSSASVSVKTRYAYND